MVKKMINPYLTELENDNVFAKVSEKTAAYKKAHPEKDVVSLGIGDVSIPIVKPIIEAMHKAVDDLANIETFSGYGNYYGCQFLKEKILENEYKKYGFTTDEIYVSDGTKSDSTNILEMFPVNSKILVGNPMYPIYRDGAKALSRNVYTTDVDEEFKMIVPNEKYDIVYICSPNNPIGNAYTYKDLEKWIEYAHKYDAKIILDNVYQAFVKDPDIPESIYELEGSKQVAIEMRSFSKKASFTGVRCSYYVVPNKLEENINTYWKRRTINRFNGACYVAQRGAEAFYLDECKPLIEKNIEYYLENAAILRECFLRNGHQVIGGQNAPFMWVKAKGEMTSWQAYDFFLNELNIIVIPGIIFGSNGDGYFRVSALGKREDVNKAVERIDSYYEKEN